MLIPVASDKTTDTVPRCPTSAKRRRALPPSPSPLLPAFAPNATERIIGRSRNHIIITMMHNRRTTGASRRRRTAYFATIKALVACGCLFSVATTVSAFCGRFSPGCDKQQMVSPLRLTQPSFSTARRTRTVGARVGAGAGGVIGVDMAAAAAAAAAAPIRGKGGKLEHASCRRRVRRSMGGAGGGGMPLNMVAVMETSSPAVASSMSTYSQRGPRRVEEGGDGSGVVGEMDGMLPPVGMANPMSPLPLRLIPTSEVRRDRRQGLGIVGKVFRLEHEVAAPRKSGGQSYTIIGESRDSTIRQLCNELRHFKLLSRDEEYVLGTKIQALMQFLEVRQRLTELLGRDPLMEEWANGCCMSTVELQESLIVCRTAKATMVRSNLRMVIAIAKRYQHLGVPLTDLIQEGSMGLIRAVEKFDPERGFKLSTYSAWWIQQAVFKGIANQSRVIRLPMHVHNLLVSVRKVEKELNPAVEEKRPSYAEVAHELRMPEQRLKRYMCNTKETVSFEIPVASKPFAREVSVLGDSLQGPDTHLPETATELGLLQAKLREVVRELPEDERHIVALRFGLVDGKSRTVAQIASVAQTTRQHVRRVESKALRSLSAPHQQRRLTEFFKDSRSPLVKELLEAGTGVRRL